MQRRACDAGDSDRQFCKRLSLCQEEYISFGRNGNQFTKIKALVEGTMNVYRVVLPAAGYFNASIGIYIFRLKGGFF